MKIVKCDKCGKEVKSKRGCWIEIRENYNFFLNTHLGLNINSYELCNKCGQIIKRMIKEQPKKNIAKRCIPRASSAKTMAIGKYALKKTGTYILHK